MFIKVMLRGNWRYLLASLAFLVGLAVLAQNVSASVGTVWRVGVGLDTGKSANNKTTDIPTTALLVGHVNWQGASGSHYIQPISLTRSVVNSSYRVALRAEYARDSNMTRRVIEIGV